MTAAPSALTRPVDLAQEVVRLALLARLALDLNDAVLARRAARFAVPLVRLLAGLDDGRQDSAPLPELDDLLVELRPATCNGEDLP